MKLATLLLLTVIGRADTFEQTVWINPPSPPPSLDQDHRLEGGGFTPDGEWGALGVCDFDGDCHLWRFHQGDGWENMLVDFWSPSGFDTQIDSQGTIQATFNYCQGGEFYNSTVGCMEEPLPVETASLSSFSREEIVGSPEPSSLVMLLGSIGILGGVLIKFRKISPPLRSQTKQLLLNAESLRNFMAPSGEVNLAYATAFKDGFLDHRDRIEIEGIGLKVQESFWEGNNGSRSL